MMRGIFGACLALHSLVLLGAAAAADASPAVIPRPAQLRVEPGFFELPPKAIFVSRGDVEAHAVGEYLAAMLGEALGCSAKVEELPRALEAAPPGHILLSTRDADAGLGDEGYALTITNGSVLLVAPQAHGLFYGVQTLRQLISASPPGDAVAGSGASSARSSSAGYRWPCVRIVDQPRYRWRGMLLDCGRHFMSKDFVKRYIDLLAYHKLNVLHWHPTDDQGWRVEIKKYPQLTNIGAWRRATRADEQPRDADGRYGGFYTQDDIREIVAYAASRFVTVVPEIEMPGHALAALASYPELSCTGGPFQVCTEWGVFDDVYCAGDDHTYEFLEAVLSEVLDLFPSEFIHIGGDECPKTRWRACPKCQARMKAEGLSDERELQSYFVRRIERYLNGKGRRLIGWDEILEGGLAPNATVQSWRGMNGAIAAAMSGHDVISSPTSHCYLDYAQARTPGEPTRMGFINLKTAYSFEPTPAELTAEQAEHVLGAEGNIWTEHAPQDRVDWQVFPRLCALAEVTWSPRTVRDWDDFCARLDRHDRRLDALGVTYFIPPPDVVSPELTFSDSIDVAFAPAFQGGEIWYTLDGTEPTRSSRKYAERFTLKDTTTVKARTFVANGRTSDVVALPFKRLRPHAAVSVPAAVRGLSYRYYEGDWQSLPKFEDLSPAASGDCGAFDLVVRQRAEQFALVWTGYFLAPVDGVYTFYLSSDDGSRLTIAGETVIDNDGLHAARELSGQVRLDTGQHPLRLEYFQAGGELGLQLEYRGPGFGRRPIPDSALSRERKD